LRTIKEMLFFEPKHRGTNIPAALGFLNHAVKRRSVVFLFTDFLHSFGTGARSVQAGRDLVQEIGMTNARHDLICAHLHDPRESMLPNAGLLTIEDVETGELLELDSVRSSVRQAYARANEERLSELDRALRQAGVDTLRFSAGDPFAQTLQAFFETRRGRRRG
jgi:uncharacterized protein (DUF58 family)